jgi:hypothetical protein
LAGAVDDVAGPQSSPRAPVDDLASQLSGAELELHNLLSDDDDDKPRRGSGSSRSGSDGPLRGVLVGLLAVVVLGGLAWYLGLTDRFGGSSGDTADGPAISVPEAGAGPLEAGQPYAVALVDSVAADATYRLRIDGEPVGEPSPAPPELVAIAGRHNVQLEVTSGGSVAVSPPVSYYASAPVEAGYRAHLANLAIGETEWTQVLAVYDVLSEQGHSQLEVLRSDDVAGVSPGRWMIAVAGFGTNGSEADTYCAEASLLAPERCWAGFVDAVTAG